MREVDRVVMGPEKRTDQFVEFPIPVAEDWSDIVHRADTLIDVIDRHLDFESKLQGRELRPSALCPEQKVSLVSDLAVV